MSSWSCWQFLIHDQRRMGSSIHLIHFRNAKGRWHRLSDCRLLQRGYLDRVLTYRSFIVRACWGRNFFTLLALLLCLSARDTWRWPAGMQATLLLLLLAAARTWSFRQRGEQDLYASALRRRAEERAGRLSCLKASAHGPFPSFLLIHPPRNEYFQMCILQSLTSCWGESLDMCPHLPAHLPNISKSWSLLASSGYCFDSASHPAKYSSKHNKYTLRWVGEGFAKWASVRPCASCPADQ